MIALASILVSSAFVPMARASISGVSSVTGPWDITWAYAIWNNRYPGNTLLFEFGIVNSETSLPNETLSSYQLVTPWNIYTDPTLPVQICRGCEYYYEVNVTIPLAQQPGLVIWNETFTGRYSDGTAYCADTGNVCSDTIGISISPDPYALEADVATLEANVTSLSSQVSTLTSQLVAANSDISTFTSQIASYQAQVTQLQGQVSTLTSRLTLANQSVASYQGQVAAANKNITSLQGQVSSLDDKLSIAKINATSLQASYAVANSGLQSAKATLATTQGQLSAAQSQLSSTQSSLNDYKSIYLPLGVAIPAVLAVLFAVLYITKKPKPTMTPTV